jgi:hypothetical protein
MAKKVKDDGKMKGSPNLPSKPTVVRPDFKVPKQTSEDAKAYAGILKSGVSKK